VNQENSRPQVVPASDLRLTPVGRRTGLRVFVFAYETGVIRPGDPA
jgi:hypothetical protein